MQPEDRDAAYLWDMLDAARIIEGFTTDVRFDQYMGDRKLQCKRSGGIGNPVNFKQRSNVSLMLH